MPTTRARFSKCMHRGLGAKCARCQTADLLEQLAASGGTYITDKRKEKPRKWSKEEMLEEARRLRAPAVKKDRFAAKTKKEAVSFIDSFIKEDQLKL